MRKSPPPAPGGLRSVLVPVDLSPLTDRVLGRLTRLPFSHGARVTLLHVVPNNLPPTATRRAVADAKRSLAAERTSVLGKLPKGVKVDARVTVGSSASEISDVAREADAELVLMGRGGGRGLRDVFLGSTAERVIRRAQVPVLAVRLRARSPYKRPAVALDVDQPPDDVLAMLLRLLAPPAPSVTVFHAYDIPYRGLVYPSLTESAADDNREYYRQKALKSLTQNVTQALARIEVNSSLVPEWHIQLRLGEARNVIPQAVRKANADILALATHGYSGIAHAFLGTVAGDVLRKVDCDVLVVPPGQAVAES